MVLAFVFGVIVPVLALLVLALYFGLKLYFKWVTKVTDVMMDEPETTRFKRVTSSAEDQQDSVRNTHQ